jgi:ketosteroid isomerase-like protein
LRAVLQLKIHHIVLDAPRSKAAVFAVGSGTTAFGGPFHNEFAVFLEFDDETGEKITALDEMMDAACVMEFFPGFRRYMARRNAEGGGERR